jgi:hypothetical protein
MDPRFADKVHGRSLMTVGTFACFLLAGALLIASLFVPPMAQSGTEGGTSHATTTPSIP